MRILFIIFLNLICQISLCQKSIADKAFFITQQFYQSTFHQSTPNIITTYPINDSENNHIFGAFLENNTVIFFTDINIENPILGYSSNVHPQNYKSLPPALQELFSDYNKQLKYIVKYNTYQQESFEKSDSKSDIEPIDSLVLSRWRQGVPYNDSCPIDSASSFNYRVVVGCVALAMGQIMHYHKHPAYGRGNHQYQSVNYGLQNANFESTFYDWNQMPNYLPDTLRSPSLAQMLYQAGVSVDMNYTLNGSGAFMENAKNALYQYFKYDRRIMELEADSYRPLEWEKLLQDQIIRHQPVIYSALSIQEGGHAFVCDGFKEDMFHFNWGWAGYFNGFYRISLLNPDIHDFPLSHSVILNIFPENTSSACENLTIYTLPVDTISDGSGSDLYLQDEYCEYLISPAVAHSLKIRFVNFNLAQGDTLFIYEGVNKQGRLIDTLTMNDVPSSYQTNETNHFYLLFKTNDVQEAQGWEIIYETESPPFCTAIDTLTEPEGVFTDGSEEFNYLNSADCYFKIKPDNAEHIKLWFEQINTEQDYDSITVYDGLTNDSPILAVYQGVLANTDTVTSTNGEMMLHFTSDRGLTMQGWEAHYTSTINNPNTSIQILPNPAHGTVFINTTGFDRNEASFQLFSMDGKLIFNKPFTENVIHIEDLKSGIYLIRIVNNENCISDKFIVR